MSESYSATDTEVDTYAPFGTLEILILNSVPVKSKEMQCQLIWKNYTDSFMGKLPTKINFEELKGYSKAYFFLKNEF